MSVHNWTSNSRGKKVRKLYLYQRIRWSAHEARGFRESFVTSHGFSSCTSSSEDGGGAATGFSVCGPRQLSTTAICCTQETVHRGAQCFFVKYSRRRSSAVYFSSGIPGYPRCCEHQ